MLNSSKKKAVIVLASVLLIAILARAAAPGLVERYVEAQLDALPDYDGQVDDVDLNFLAGSYTIERILIEKTSGEASLPFFTATSIETRILWGALLNGDLVVEMDFYQPMLNFIDSKSEQQQQFGLHVNWLYVVDQLVALNVDRLSVRDGWASFRNFDAEPPVDVQVSSLELDAVNLTNTSASAAPMPASITAQGTVLRTGTLTADIELDPSVHTTTFEADLSLTGMPMEQADALIAYYAPFDVDGGEIDLIAEINTERGRLDGYLKPLIHDLEVFEWERDVVMDQDNPLRMLWESMVNLVGELLENQSANQLATVIPLSGSLNQPELGLAASFGNILRNAFINAYQSDFEDISQVQTEDTPPENTTRNSQP